MCTGAPGLVLIQMGRPMKALLVVPQCGRSEVIIKTAGKRLMSVEDYTWTHLTIQPRQDGVVGLPEL